ncbi:MAG TPA: hypothetical protein VI603_10930 [Saprospiraceae bacterium]|nr:hypothetical protein [Saprospiraceae bacterium]
MHQKKLLTTILITAFMFVSSLIFGQAVGIGTPSPDTSALLEVSSTDKGVLIPRMTTAQREMISTPAVGLLVFDMETESFWFKETSGWVNLVAHEADPQISSSVMHKVPKWNGTTLIDGLITDDDTNVGIGTFPLGHPERNLHIAGPLSQSVFIQSGGGDAKLELMSDNSVFSTLYAPTGTDDLRFNHEGTGDVMTLTHAGNVGIGTIAPSAKLHVAGGDALINSITVGLGGSGINNNTVLGSEALQGNTTGNRNTATGFRTLSWNTTGEANTAIGHEALLNNNSFANTALGAHAMSNLTDGYENTAIGHWTMLTNTTGDRNTVVGDHSDVGDVSLFNATAIGAYSVVNTSNSLVLGNNANVGIGTSAPDTKLHVVGSIKMVDGNQADGRVMVSDTSGLASWQVPSVLESDPQVSSASINRIPKWNGSTLVDGILTDNGSVVKIGDLEFNSDYLPTATMRYVHPDMPSGGDVMHLDIWSTPNEFDFLDFRRGSEEKFKVSQGGNVYVAGNMGVVGNVGIGTTNPAFKLEVNGTFAVNDLKINNGALHRIEYINSCIAEGGDFMHVDFWACPNEFDFLDFRRGPTQKFRVTQGGNVYADGLVFCREVEVSLADFPDYVFATEYDLMSLQEIEEFIVKHGHLPNVPSAKDVEENGIGLGTLNKILLEKIEELTLHIIDKDKQIELLRAQVSERQDEMSDQIARIEALITKTN